jgi:diguanylate cyclase (GGDEF)-like protein/hemerythrin-like metal-binding protein
MHNVEWKPELSVGIEDVDTDHKRLIELTNTLINAIDKETPKAELLKIFEELEAYTHYHFTREEGFMDEHCTNDGIREMIRNHKAQHRYFVNRLPELKEHLIQSSSKSVSYEIVEFLLHWLLDHIINEDLKLSQCLHDTTEEKRSLIQRLSDTLATKTTIHQRLLLIFILPLIFFVIQTLFISYSGYQKFNDLEKAHRITQAAVKINDVITQLQKERGLSSAYIASNYQRFKKELDTQRHLTDSVIKHGLHIQKYLDPYIDLSKRAEALQRLYQIRTMIDMKKTNHKEGTAYYSNFIQTLIDIIKHISYLPFNNIDQNTYASLLLLLHINETQGQIRNEGIISLEKPDHSHREFEKLLRKRENYLHTFNMIAPPRLQQQVAQIEQESQDVVQMQKKILQNKLIDKHAVEQWYEKTTHHIEKYKYLIESSLQEIAHKASQQQDHFVSLILTIWLIFAAITLFFGISVLLLKESILQPLKVLTQALHNLSSGDKGFYFKHLHKKDAFGKMERAYNHLRRSLIKADYANVLMDLQELKTQKYERLSEEDPLTGIYNRRAFMQLLNSSLEEAQRHQQPLSLLLLDLDHFKQVNDTYGHDTGDKLLQCFTNHIKKIIRNHDIFARIGGEEFVLLLPYTSPQDAWKIAEDIVQQIAALDLEDLAPGLKMTVSIGHAKYEENMGMRTFLQKADTHLYEAKRKGRNRVCCDKTPK